LSNGAITSDLKRLLSTLSHSNFYILCRLWYFRNGRRERLRIW